MVNRLGACFPASMQSPRRPSPLPVARPCRRFHFPRRRLPGCNTPRESLVGRKIKRNERRRDGRSREKGRGSSERADRLRSSVCNSESTLQAPALPDPVTLGCSISSPAPTRPTRQPGFILRERGSYELSAPNNSCLTLPASDYYRLYLLPDPLPPVVTPLYRRPGDVSG